VPTNLAEGCGREGDRELGRFIAIASGSVSEAEYQVLLAKDLGYISATDHSDLEARIQEVRKMLYSLHRSLEL
jgi:four helix bundle protein